MSGKKLKTRKIRIGKKNYEIYKQNIQNKILKYQIITI